MPLKLGNSLLVLMSDTPASLALIETILPELTDPAHVDITLGYYLEPVVWQLADAGISEILQNLLEQEGTLLDAGQPTAPPVFWGKARTLLTQHGIPVDRVHIEDHWRQPDLISHRKTQLHDGFFSAVIIVRHHYNLLFGLLGVTLREVLNQFGRQIHVTILDLNSPP